MGIMDSGLSNNYDNALRDDISIRDNNNGVSRDDSGFSSDNARRSSSLIRAMLSPSSEPGYDAQRRLNGDVSRE